MEPGDDSERRSRSRADNTGPEAQRPSALNSEQGPSDAPIVSQSQPSNTRLNATNNQNRKKKWDIISIINVSSWLSLVVLDFVQFGLQKKTGSPSHAIRLVSIILYVVWGVVFICWALMNLIRNGLAYTKRYVGFVALVAMGFLWQSDLPLEKTFTFVIDLGIAIAQITAPVQAELMGNGPVRYLEMAPQAHASGTDLAPPQDMPTANRFPGNRPNASTQRGNRIGGNSLNSDSPRLTQPSGRQRDPPRLVAWQQPHLA